MFQAFQRIAVDIFVWYLRQTKTSAETRHARCETKKVWKNKGCFTYFRNDIRQRQDGTAGSRRSFQELAAPLIDGLYRYAMKLTNSPEDAQDLVRILLNGLNILILSGRGRICCMDDNY